jgi:L-iditol 2-dehydrogenase
MRAVYFLGDRKIDIRSIPDPTPGPGEVVIEIKASGMCGTDLKYYRAKDGASAIGFSSSSSAPVIAGHEPCGIVCAVGSGVTSPLARIDRRVMNHHYAGCGCCNSCRTGWTQMCDEGSIVFGANANGAHAKYMKVPAESLVSLPDDLSFQTGAAISCGTGTAWGGLQRLGLRGNDTITIFGQGPVGLSGTQLSTAMGARVIAVDFDDARLQSAAELGAHITINARAEDAAAVILEATHGRGVECSMDCTGASAARSAAIRSTGKWGRVVFVGEGGDVTIDVSTEMNRKQLSIYGSWTFSKSGQADCARFVAERKIDIDSLFTHSWPLEEAEAAYTLFDTQTTGKGFLIPD